MHFPASQRPNAQKPQVAVATGAVGWGWCSENASAVDWEAALVEWRFPPPAAATRTVISVEAAFEDVAVTAAGVVTDAAAVVVEVDAALDETPPMSNRAAAPQRRASSGQWWQQPAPRIAINENDCCGWGRYGRPCSWPAARPLIVNQMINHREPLVHNSDMTPATPVIKA